MAIYALAAVQLPAAPPIPVAFDVLIHGGHVVDGTGNPWYAADVGVTGGRIAWIGTAPGATGKRVIDATGLIVAPGFIDLHTHSDTSILGDGDAPSKVRQGVTLEVLGEGQSVAPRDGLPPVDGDGVHQDWTTFSDYFTRVLMGGSAINIASSVSYHQVRRVVMGYEPRPATPTEIERMRQLVARSMQEGAIGLVTQLEGGTWYPDEIQT